MPTSLNVLTHRNGVAYTRLYEKHALNGDQLATFEPEFVLNRITFNTFNICDALIFAISAHSFALGCAFDLFN